MELEKLTLKCILEQSNKLYSSKNCLSWADGRTNRYSDFYTQAIDVQLVLIQKGISKGDKVALLSENQPNWGAAYFAITSMGAIVVPILPDFLEHQVHHILRHAECKAVFVSKKQFVKVDEFYEDTLHHKFLLDNFSIIPLETTIAKLKNVFSQKAQPFIKMKDKALEFTGLKVTDVNEDDIACIIYTSGTTGHSKGVVLTHKSLVFDAIAMSSIHLVTSSDRYLSVLPLSHTYECTGSLIIAIMSGASVYYLKKPPTARVLLPAMQKIKPTIMMTVPLIIEKIYKLKIKPALTSTVLGKAMFAIPMIRVILHYIAGRKLYKSFGGNLKFFGIGGALLSAEVEKFLIDCKFPYAIGYGLTETSPLIAGSGPFKTKYRSTGWAPNEIKIRLANLNEKTGEGEIETTGPNVMKGYYKDKEKTAEVFTKDGWFKTGDLGILDKYDYLYIKGRSKNVIIGSSGENVYPEEIEEKINKNPLVVESLVYDSENKITARIHLNYELIDKQHGGKKYSEPRIRKFIEKLLADIKKNVNSQLSSSAKIINVIEQTEPFDKTPTKKIKRFIYTK